MSIALSAQSLARLQGCHRDIVKVVLKAATMTPADLPWEVMEGMRSVSQQKENIKKGVSWTMNSRHLTGHAVDIVPRVDLNGDGKLTTAERYSWPLYYKLAPIFKAAAKSLGIRIVWGGDWKKNKDGPHFELDRRAYPATKASFAQLSMPFEDLPEYEEPETESGAAGKAAATGATGVASGMAVGYNPAVDIATSVSMQQYELSSGDIIRVVLAVVIIGLSVWGAYKMAKG